MKKSLFTAFLLLKNVTRLCEPQYVLEFTNTSQKIRISYKHTSEATPEKCNTQKIVETG